MFVYSDHNYFLSLSAGSANTTEVFLQRPVCAGLSAATETLQQLSISTAPEINTPAT